MRSRAKILAAAARSFAETGLNAPLDEIARSAGVGNATLYRHFATRDALVIAVYEDRIGGLSSLAGSHTGDPARQLLEWLDQLVELISVDVGLRNAFSGGLPGTVGQAAIGRWRSMLLSRAEPLFEAAERAGAIRGALTFEDLMALVHAVAEASEGNGARARRLLRLATNDERARAKYENG